MRLAKPFPLVIAAAILTSLFVFPSCCMFGDVETDPDKIETTVGEWEPPMLEVLGELLIYRPDLADDVQPWIETFSQDAGATIMVKDMRSLQPLLLAYIHEIDQDDTLTSDEKDLNVAIPNVWLDAIRNYLGEE